MNIKVNDVLELDNDSYKVIDVINHNDNFYLFLINNDEFQNDTSIVKVIKNEKNIELKHIEDDKEFEVILKKIYLNHKRDILSYFD